MKDRIKMIRMDNNMTQTDFGKAIGVKGNTITNYESGIRNPSEAIIISICREFNVNENWLRTGEGAPYNSGFQDISSYINRIAAGDDYLIKDIIDVYMELDQNSRSALKHIAEKMYQKRKERENN